MKLSSERLRILIVGMLFASILVAYGLRLMNLQVVQGESFQALASQGSAKEQSILSTRGEIVDRNGTILAGNTISYNIILDRAFLPSGPQELDIILSTLEVLQENGESWIDNLPLTTTEPYAFVQGNEAAVSLLKNTLDIAQYNDAAITYENLLERYHLQDTPYSVAQKRTLTGIKYEMERTGFNIKVPYILAKDVSIETITKIKERNFQLQGVDYQQSSTRIYLNGTVAPHLIGHIGLIYKEEYTQELIDMGYGFNDRIGKEGIELSMEKYLRGKDGSRLIRLNSNGEVVSSSVKTPAIPGNTVVLTIDGGMQKVAQKAMEDQIRNLNATAKAGKGKEADAGAVVAINVKTGEVLAAVTYPFYDLVDYRTNFDTLSADPLNPLWDRTLQGQYRPGSTFKPTVALAALNAGTVEPHSTVLCTYRYSFYPDYPAYCLSTHGNQDVYAAIRNSCNIYFYDVGRRVGINAINTTALGLGLGEPTGVEISEQIGRRSSPEYSASMGATWYEGNVIQAAIGQLDSAFTPMQLANYAATIANKGTRMDLNLVQSVQSYDGSTIIWDNVPSVAYQMDIPVAHFEVLTNAMVQTSRIGSAAAYLADYPIDIASKTGTPETVLLPNSTFICFAPADDPEIAIAVVIEKGWHGYTGAPVARKIFDYYFYGNTGNLPTPAPDNELLP